MPAVELLCVGLVMALMPVRVVTSARTTAWLVRLVEQHSRGVQWPEPLRGTDPADVSPKTRTVVRLAGLAIAASASLLLSGVVPRLW